MSGRMYKGVTIERNYVGMWYGDVALERAGRYQRVAADTLAGLKAGITVLLNKDKG